MKLAIFLLFASLVMAADKPYQAELKRCLAESHNDFLREQSKILRIESDKIWARGDVWYPKSTNEQVRAIDRERIRNLEARVDSLEARIKKLEDSQEEIKPFFWVDSGGIDKTIRLKVRSRHVKSSMQNLELHHFEDGDTLKGR